MPLPKTDEEIKASWSPQEWKFHAWEEKNIKNILDTQNRDAEWDAYSKLVKQAWPDRDDRGKYLEWAHTWNGRIFVRNKYVMNTKDYIEMISQANFLDMDKVNRLSRNILVYPMPFVAIGEAHFGGVFSGYAFTPMTNFLEPKYPDSDSDVLGNMILALNINVAHPPPLPPGSSVNSSDTNSDSKSSVSTELSQSFQRSTTSQPHSPVWDFVFVQLGLLWTFTGDWKKARQGNPNDDKRGEWNPNGFAVVVRLSPKGEPGKVYALRHPDAKQEGNKKSTHKRGFMLKHYKPGHPHPKSDSSFCIAKIADSIQELGSYGREFEFEIVPSDEPQIVNAKIWIYELDGPALTPVREPDDIDI
ncbi:hypothetical protein FMEXI_9622 [Fusarium mexicanum]|uniref:Uncharacterized protein n=1 Tax=Fusarium mexicanum TaxID=751941 RepID=A0A8H5MQT4_9HYPO|nr:hypothetical protein FMEXI_9622 [Fusarium mexicanum]